MKKIILSLMLLSVQAFYAQTIYVNAAATGTNDGTSWANAYTSLQSALTAAVSYDQIWVAKGTYKPSYDYGLGGGPRYYHFRMKSLVAIYGGFAGTETAVSQRTKFGIGSPNETILSGDIGTVGDNSDNCYHVFYQPKNSGYLTALTRLDGFTISGGNANGSGDFSNGGGIFFYQQSPTITNCTFSNNSAINDGGGIYCTQSGTLSLSNSIFSANVANQGGGIFNGAFYYVSMISVAFSGNKANADGGGIYCTYSTDICTNCTFSGNQAVNNGGGVFNLGDNLTSYFNNSIFWGNTATLGNQVYIGGSNSPLEFHYCDIQGGSAAFGLASGVSYTAPYDNNIDADPQFQTPVPSPAPTIGGNLRLISNYPTNSSPCYDAGWDGYASATARDLDGEPRIQVYHVDMGAYEGGNAPPTPTIYVDKNAKGNNDGVSWTNAFTDLQVALVYARTCPGFDTVKVAAGIYKPTNGTDRTVSFAMINGVSILGDYPTGGGIRNWTTNKTILSGDLNGDDVGFTNNAENSYHVINNPNNLALTASAVLDGVTISGGNANDSTGSINNEQGGGMYNDSFSGTVSNCIITNNFSWLQGGGIYNQNSSPTFIGCTISNNQAHYYLDRATGGGMYNTSSSPVITNCIFTANKADECGGMENFSSSSVITGCIFSGNQIISESGNAYGGGMENSNYCTPIITNCSFLNNSSQEQGGGMANYVYATPIITNCTFMGNSSRWGGGMISAGGASPVLTNCTFYGNTAAEGGAINIVCYLGPRFTMKNSILYGNSAGSGNQIYLYLISSTPDFYNCDIQGGQAAFGYETAATDTGAYVNNIDADPKFIDVTTGDLRLYGNSPCVNIGNNTFNTQSLDIRGQARIQNTTIDLGAYEWTNGIDPVCPVIYVKNNSSGLNTGKSWTDAFTSLQSALNVAVSGDQIWVAKGTYKPSSAYGLDSTNTRNYHFQLINGVAIYGGFAGTETALSQRTNFSIGKANETILSGDIGTVGDNSDNCYHVIYNPAQTPVIDNTAILDGVTIENANANGINPQNRGGGICNYSSSPTLTNLSIMSNTATYGGGVYNLTSSPSFTNCVIIANSDSLNGGGMGNSTSASPIITNTTIANNSAGSHGGGIDNYNNSSPILNNCIVWGNSAATAKQFYISGGSKTNITLNYSCYSNSTNDVVVGSGTSFTATNKDITTDPKFINASGNDYRLFGNSPCVNSGNNSYNLLATDLLGRARIQNTTIDMGAYEWTAEVDPLPVELTTFTAENVGDKIELHWQTATEVNNYGFEIQRSAVKNQDTSASSWEQIGFVKGSGNSNSPKSYSFVDDNPVSGTIDYRLKQIDNDGNFKYSQTVTITSIPAKFELFQNYPNPFNPTTTIQYALPQSEHVTLKIYDELGREVMKLVDENKVAGDYKVTFNGSSLASGIYFFRYTAGSFNQVKKLILLK